MERGFCTVTLPTTSVLEWKQHLPSNLDQVSYSFRGLLAYAFIGLLCFYFDS